MEYIEVILGVLFELNESVFLLPKNVFKLRLVALCHLLDWDERKKSVSQFSIRCYSDGYVGLFLYIVAAAASLAAAAGAVIT